MIDVTKMVELIFQLINFVVIIGLVLFLFKKYLLGGIRAQMHAKNSVLLSLKNSFHMLTRNYQLVEREIVHEQQMQNELKEKVMIWRAQVDREHEQLLKERDERIEKLKSHAKIQIKEIQKTILYRRVLPYAIKDARLQLEQQFASEQAQEEYLKTAVRDMSQKRKA